MKPQTCVHGRCVVNYCFVKNDFIQWNCVAQLKPKTLLYALCLQEKVGLPNVPQSLSNCAYQQPQLPLVLKIEK
jgi:hypothetical protein